MQAAPRRPLAALVAALRSSVAPLLTASAVALPALAPPPASAQAVVELEPLVIPGALVPLDADPAGSSVTTLGRAELQQAGPTLGAALASLPGFTLTSQGPFGDGAAGLRIRGLGSGYMAVLIDGIPVGDPTSTRVGYDFGRLLGAGAGQVEVLRGSQSAHWGGSAVAGVIAISSLAGIEDGLHQSVTAEAGTYDTGALSYGVTQKDERMELAFSLSHFRTSGWSAFDGGAEADGGEATRLSFAGRYAVNDALTVGGALFVQRTLHDFDGWGYDLAGAYTTRNEGGARLFAEFELGDSQQLVEIAAFRTRRETHDPSMAPYFPVDSEYTGRTLRLGWRGTSPLGAALTLVYGADWTRESASYTALPGGSAHSDVAGAWLQAVWEPTPDLQLAASVRHDRNSDFGSSDTGKLALAWHPTADSTVRAAIGTGFRAPSLDERYGDYGTFIGNPHLAPEKSRSFELGFDHEFAGGATLSATLFRLETDNRIASTGSSLENKSGKSVSKGLELGAGLPLGERFGLKLAYSYTDTQDADGARFVGVPRHHATLGLDGQLTDRLSGGLQIRHVADRPLDQGAPMPDYTLVSARMAYAVTDTVEAYLRVENLGDVHYQTTKDYGQSGRAVYLGLQARF